MKRRVKVPHTKANCKYGCCVHWGSWNKYRRTVKLKQVKPDYDPGEVVRLLGLDR